VPDATGLELLARELRESEPDSVRDTEFFRNRAALHIEPGAVRAALRFLREQGFGFMASLHGLDYYPEEPRLGVQYELLNMSDPDRITVKLRVPTTDPHVDSVVEDWPTANHQEREVFDMFGVIFDDHPDLRRILMPEDYEGYPQRRDFPLGGEPVLFTHNEPRMPGWWE
jgi:NADH-quinone oxidoreductase subunit C